MRIAQWQMKNVTTFAGTEINRSIMTGAGAARMAQNPQRRELILIVEQIVLWYSFW